MTSKWIFILDSEKGLQKVAPSSGCYILSYLLFIPGVETVFFGKGGGWVKAYLIYCI